MAKKKFSGEIVVASKIVDYLSSGLYESPSACLKELINNSYDADAKRVDVFVKPDADRIIIEDNGTGMTRKEFEKHFGRISESYKRDDSDQTSSGRPKVGKIGIGFIAANEICDTMEIVSTKAGSTELLEVAIQFDVMREEEDARTREGSDIAKGDFFGHVSETDAESHFTKLFLKRVRGEAQNILAGAGSTPFSAGKRSLYGKNCDTVYNELVDDSLKTWSQFDPYSRNMLEIGLNVPVAYHDKWLPEQHVEADFSKHAASLDFELHIDGTEVRKPSVFRSSLDSLFEPFEFSGKHVGATGYFYAQHGVMRPEELHGLLIRIRNAALGKYDSSFLGFTSSIGPLFQGWISAEVWADDRLESAMNIDRRTLRVSHPAFVEFQKEIHERLSTFLQRIRAEIYAENNRERRDIKARVISDKISEVAKSSIAEISKSASKDVSESWRLDANDPKKMLKKFSIDQIYRAVTLAAQETLSPSQLRRFLKRLTELLKK